MEQPSDFIVEVSAKTLGEITKACKAYLHHRGGGVEPGGIAVGTYDGRNVVVKELLLDEHANSTPARIQLSSNIWTEARAVANQRHEETHQPWFILGTWHGHPSGYDTFSSVDEDLLFRERMRLQTDDPSLAHAPWVHFIFSNYGQEPQRVKVFTMQLTTSYSCGAVSASNHFADHVFTNEISGGLTIGLLVGSADNDQHWQLVPYHPDYFQKHQANSIVIRGLWKYFPFQKITHEFEKVFLENFCQKTRLEEFVYVRILLNEQKNGTAVQWLQCRRRGEWDLFAIVRFTEIPFFRQISFQNPDIAQTVVLSFPEEAMTLSASEALTKELKLPSPPVMYAYMLDDAAVELSTRTAVEGPRVILPDDLLIAYVLSHLRDPELPIYFQSTEIDANQLLKLRTLRFCQMGHDVSALQKRKVLIGGVGLLGSEIAYNLATLGVGFFHVVDNGVVDWLNIYRQPLFSKTDVYKKKVDVVKHRLEQMGAVTVNAITLEVPSWDTRLGIAQMEEHVRLLDDAVKDVDIVVGTFDRFSPRAVFQCICLARQRPFLVAALEAFLGQVTLFNGRKPGCYYCGLPSPQERKWPDRGACTLARLESQRIVAALATKLIVDTLEGRELDQNAIQYQVSSMAIQAAQKVGSPRCALCGPSGIVRTFAEDLPKAICEWLFNEHSTSV